MCNLIILGLGRILFSVAAGLLEVIGFALHLRVSECCVRWPFVSTFFSL